MFEVHRISEAFAQLAADPRVVGVARQILGSDVYVHQSRINVKPGFGARGFYWHSDFETWHAEDGLPRMRTVSVSIALTPNYPTNGGLMIMPGSHRTFLGCAGETPKDNYKRSLQMQDAGIPSQEALTKFSEACGIRLFTGQAGSATWFDCNAMHGSGDNITPTRAATSSSCSTVWRTRRRSPSRLPSAAPSSSPRGTSSRCADLSAGPPTRVTSRGTPRRSARCSPHSCAAITLLPSCATAGERLWWHGLPQKADGRLGPMADSTRIDARQGENRAPRKASWRHIGPGIVVAATGVGAGDLVATLIAGGKFGYTLLWAAVIGCLVKVSLAEAVGRWHLATGRTLFDGWRSLGPWTTFYFVGYVVVWGFVYGAAAMSSSALPLAALFPDVMDLKGWAVLCGLVGLVFVWFNRYAVFEKVMTVLVGVMFLVTVYLAIRVTPTSTRPSPASCPSSRTVR